MPKLTHAQRLEIPKWSLAHNGWGNGTGYPGKRGNPACKYCGIGDTYSCACGNTATCGKAGFPLKSMQPGMEEGYDNCAAAYQWGQKHNALINSWVAKIGDLILVDTGGGAQPGHTECIYKIDGTGPSRRIFTIGWDSGPSNVDGFRGQGGTHKHVWSDPVGKGNPAIMGVLDLDKCVDWSKVDAAHKPPKRKKLRRQPLHKTPESTVTPQPTPPRHPWYWRFLNWWNR